MPIEIVLIRHGICTGNEAEKASRKGNHSLFTRDVRRVKSTEWPLTSEGKRQSKIAGEIIKQRISDKFDYYVTSDIVRAVETAEHIGFKDAKWIKDSLWRERVWGGVENVPLSERSQILNRLGISVAEDGLDWRPPRGESMIPVIKRVEQFLRFAQNHLLGKKILVSTHGGPVIAMRIIQHNVSPDNYVKFISGNNYIRNCHIFQYSVRCYDDRIPKFKLERSLFEKMNGDWQDNTQELNNK